MTLKVTTGPECNEQRQIIGKLILNTQENVKGDPTGATVFMKARTCQHPISQPATAEES